jgi:hypothetical protein
LSPYLIAPQLGVRSTVGKMVGSNGWTVPIRGFELLEVWLSGETYLIL